MDTQTKGTIVDQGTNQPIKGANIKIVNPTTTKWVTLIMVEIL